jgi:hypothetical protein
MTQQFWLYDPTILMNRDVIKDLYPTIYMSSVEKLNAITRAVILISVLGYILTKQIRMIIFGLMTLFCIVAYFFITNKHTTKEKLYEGFRDLVQTQINPNQNSISTTSCSPMKKTMNEMGLTRPSSTNPMMNVLLTDIQDHPQRPQASPSTNPLIESELNQSTKQMSVQQLIHSSQNSNTQLKQELDERLFRDLGDAYQFDTSMRQFYTTPNTQIPNDQKSFAEFCYGDMISCKEGEEMACSRSMPPQHINP